MLDLPGVFSSQWQPIINTTGDRELFAERYGEAPRSKNVVAGFPGIRCGVPRIRFYSCILGGGAKTPRLGARDYLLGKCGSRSNSLYLMNHAEARKTVPESLPEFCHAVRMGCPPVLKASPTRPSVTTKPWYFTFRRPAPGNAPTRPTRVLDVEVFSFCLPSVADVGNAVRRCAVVRRCFKSVSGFEMYRKKYGRIAPDRIVEFSAARRANFPRAVRYSIGRADQALHAITGTPPRRAFSCASGTNASACCGRSWTFAPRGKAILEGGLHEFFDALQTKNEYHRRVYRE